jgi:3-oxoacyl-[acyl-carrier protein] reductase
MLLTNKTAIIYGAAGAVGGATARAFAREGANVFIAGRTRQSLDLVADDITAQGGKVQVAQLDALDPQAVEHHLAEVVTRTGSVDISFNAVALGDTQGAPLTGTKQETFFRPIETACRTHFLTTTAAARHMSRQGSGVILALSAQAARKPYADVGGFGVACAAIEALCRQLAVELGPRGIRVVCISSAGSPDTPDIKESWSKLANNAGITLEAFQRGIAERTMLKRMPMLAEIANVAVLMASDLASSISGAIANATCGEIAD